MRRKLLTEAQKRRLKKEKEARRQERERRLNSKEYVENLKDASLIEEMILMYDNDNMAYYTKEYIEREMRKRPLDVQVQKDLDLLESVRFHEIEKIKINPQTVGAMVKRALTLGNPTKAMEMVYHLQKLNRPVTKENMKKFSVLVAEKGTVQENMEWIYFYPTNAMANIERIIKANNPTLLAEVAGTVASEKGMKEVVSRIEAIILKANDAESSLLFSQIDGANIQAHGKIIKASKNPEVNKYFATYHKENKTITAAQARAYFKIAEENAVNQ